MTGVLSDKKTRKNNGQYSGYCFSFLLYRDLTPDSESTLFVVIVYTWGEWGRGNGMVAGEGE